VPYRQYMESETRFSMLWHSHPGGAEVFAAQAQAEINQRFQHYRQLAAMDWGEGETLGAARAQLRRQAPPAAGEEAP
jgi:pyruvate-ferredoxin/flavodoxin oxidoreductase